MKHNDLNGVIAAATTPLTTSFEIDANRLAHHCETLLNDGCSFVSTFGTTGEGASLSSAQKVAALGHLSASGLDMSRQIPSIMASSFYEAGLLVKEAARLGCRAVLVLPPFYYPQSSHEGITNFFEQMLKVAKSPQIDMLLYNIPQFSRVSFTPALIGALLDKFGDAIIGIKDSTGDLENGKMLVNAFPSLNIFTGDDRVMPDLVSAGGAGMIGGMPNMFSADLRKIFGAPAHGQSTALKQKSAERIQSVDQMGGLLVLKTLLARRYNDETWSRAAPPLADFSSEQQRDVRARFDEIDTNET